MIRKVSPIKRNLCIVPIMCLVCLMTGTLESEAQDLEYFMKMGHYQALQAPMFPKLLDQTKLLEATDVGNKAQKSLKPPLNRGKIAVQFLAGGVGGIAVGSLGASLDTSIGAPVGSTVGVYIVGTIGHETGSFLATFGGAFLGFTVGLLGGRGGDPLIYMSIPPSIGAIIGFYLTRRYKSPPASGNALINYRDGQMRLAVPTISFRPDPYDRGALTQRVDLVKTRF